MKECITVVNLPVAPYWLYIADDVVIRAGFGIPPADILRNDGHAFGSVVHNYVNGKKVDLTKIPHAQHGSNFYKDIWDAMERIPAGKPVSYKILAAMAGHSAAVRAAGTACGANALPLIVPCHRVIKSDGSEGNYGPGVKIKEWLLGHERSLT